MGAPKGNQFWKARAKHGRVKLYNDDPKLLLEACYEYFQWVEDNPLWEVKVTQYQGTPIPLEVPKMRAMTIGGLCTFIGISREGWTKWRVDKDYEEIVDHIECIIRDQKFAGAAADLFNANIIAREIGLTEKTENVHSIRELSEDELDNRIKALENELKAKS